MPKWEDFNKNLSGKDKGKLKGNIFGVPNGLEAQSRLPEKMLPTVESLSERYKQVKQDLIKQAREKGTYTPENLKKQESIKKGLLRIPLMHTTRDSKIPHYVVGRTEMKSYKKMLEEKPELMGNTYDSDKELGRDEFVYAYLGRTYGGTSAPDTNTHTICFDPKLLFKSTTYVQDPKLVGTEPEKIEQDFEHMNKAMLKAKDWFDLFSLGLALDVVDKDLAEQAEIMFLDEVSTKGVIADIIIHDDEDTILSDDDIIDKLFVPMNTFIELQSSDSPLFDFNDERDWKEKIADLSS